MKSNFQNYIFSIGIFITSIIFCLFLGEMYLRYKSPLDTTKVADNKYYVWPPNMRKIFYPKYMPGINNPSKFSINSEGIRGPEMDDTSYRILCLGGSTTESIYLDDQETWPQLLMDKLNKNGKHTWVGNAGKSGAMSWHHISELKYLLPQIKPDLVLILIGINDLGLYLAHYADIESYTSSDDFLQQISLKPSQAKKKATKRNYSGRSWYKNLRLWGRLRFFRDKCYNPKLSLLDNLINLPKIYNKINNLIQSGFLVHDEVGEAYERMRKKRRSSPKIDIPPILANNLGKVLQLYENNIKKMIEISRTNKDMHVIFMTQPSSWHKEMSADEERLLWSGSVGKSSTKPNAEYLSPEDMDMLLSSFNKKLIEVCKKENSLYIDLAEYIPNNLDSFYDDCHFNENGAFLVSDVIAENLKKMGFN